MRRFILSLEGFLVFLLGFGADVTAWGEHVAVLAYFFERCAFAEAGDGHRCKTFPLTPTLSRQGRGSFGLTFTLTPALSRRGRGRFGRGETFAPGVVGIGDAGDVFVGQFAVGAVDHTTQFAGVDEQDFAAPVAELAVFAVAGKKPQLVRRGSGSSRKVGRAARPCSPRVVGFDQVSPDFALAGLADDMEPLASTKPVMPLGAR